MEDFAINNGCPVVRVRVMGRKMHNKYWILGDVMGFAGWCSCSTGAKKPKMHHRPGHHMHRHAILTFFEYFFHSITPGQKFS
jgi:hypothetical protein